jgi:lantibiotic modifying enzyme
MSPFLDTACAIARRISRDAIWWDGRCNWIGPFMETFQVWDVRHKSLGPDFYCGTSGVALFLALAAEAADDRLIRKTAEGAARHAVSHAKEVPKQQRIGVYSGTLGIAWALLEISRILGDGGWTEQGIGLLDGIEGDIPGAGLDVMSGYAGAIPAFLSLARRYGRPDWTELSFRCGEALEAAAVRSSEGWSWKTIDIPGQRDSRNLTGFSHGAAGIGWALLELSEATGEPRFRSAADEAFRYERRHYSPEHENWPDFRDYLRPPGGNGPVFGTAWCHGAPGIALSRLRAWGLTADPKAREDAEAALRTTRRSLEAPDAARSGFSLCHGCAGNGDVLLEAAQCLGESDARQVAENVGHAGIEQFEAKRLPWPCGLPGAGETPGLMLGTAGIGHFYLRLAPDWPERSATPRSQRRVGSVCGKLYLPRQFSLPITDIM